MDVKIFEQEIKDEKGQVKGKFAVLYGGLESESPKNYMDDVVRKYTNGVSHAQYVDILMDNPWTRVIVSGIKNLKFEEFINQKL